MDRDLIASSYTDAAWKAVEHFPVDAKDIELVSHSENVTFRVAVRDVETHYVLRLHRPGYCSIEELESERLWVSALEETGVSVQDSLETYQGGHYALVDIPGEREPRYAGMLTWHEGMPLHDFLESSSDGPERKRMFRRLGEIAAAMHNQSARWQAPSGFTRRRLGLEDLLGEDPFWGRFWEHSELTESEQALLLRARDKARAALSAYGERPDKFSLIHADFSPYNVIYDGHDLAVIDFDDSAYGWHLYDIVSALIECRFYTDFETLQAAMLEGYRQCRSLAMQDVDMLSDFLLVRGMAIVGWFHQRPEHAGSEYFEGVKNRVLDACSARGF